jgi:hypothetical protein
MHLPQGWFYNVPTNTLSPHRDAKFHDTAHFIKLCKNHRSLLIPTLRLCYSHTLIFAKDDITIDSIIQSLSKTFTLEDQGSVYDFLGIQIHKDNTTKTIHLTERCLINSILIDVSFTDTSITKHTPSDSIKHLGKIVGIIDQLLAN